MGPQAPHLLYQLLQLQPPALETVKQPLQLVAKAFLGGAFLGMTAPRRPPPQGNLPRPPQCQPPLLAGMVCLAGDFLEMGAILPGRPQQLMLKQQLLVGVAFWAGASLVADANRKPLQPPQQRQQLPPQQQPQPNVEVLLVVVYWAAKYLIK